MNICELNKHEKHTQLLFRPMRFSKMYKKTLQLLHYQIDKIEFKSKLFVRFSLN